MRYHSPALLQTPSISGAVDGYSVSMFASEHGELDARSQRRLTAIEILLQTELPFAIAAASGGMVQIVEGLELRQEYKPPVKGWDDTYVLRTNNLKLCQAYFNEDRLRKLVSLMNINKSWITLLFYGNQGVLRLDTPLPIDHPKEIDVIIKQMINVARAIELEKGEDKDLIRQHERKDKTGGVLEIDEDLLDDDIGFELEDEEIDFDLEDDDVFEVEDSIKDVKSEQKSGA